MAKRKSLKTAIARACLALAAIVVALLYIVGCIQQARGKYQQERDKRDHVKGQIQPVPHELGK